MNQKPNYGNWVPEKLLYLTFGGTALFLVFALLSGLAFSNTPLAVICAILCAVLLAFGIYMYACHECFAFGKGDMMAKVHAHLVAISTGTDTARFSTSAAALPRSPSAVPRHSRTQRSPAWITGVRSGTTPKSSVKKMRQSRASLPASILRKAMRHT